MRDSRSPNPSGSRDQDRRRRCTRCRFDEQGNLLRSCRECFARGITQAEFEEKRRRNR